MLARALKRVGAFGTILDLPCGAGRLTPTLARVADRVVCADLAGPMIDEARDATAGIARPRDGLQFVRSSALRMPFADKSFDVVVCWRLLQHLRNAADRAALFREMARVARHAVILSFSDSGTWRARFRRLCGRGSDSARSRVVISRQALSEEARQGGLVPVAFFRLSSAFSVVAASAMHVAPDANGSAS